MKIIRITQEFKNGNKRALVEVTCDRCNGLRQLEHLKHVEGGVCYKCNGKGIIEKSEILMTKENEEIYLKKKESERLKKLRESELRASELRASEFNSKQEELKSLENIQKEKNKVFFKKYELYFKNLDVRNNYIRDTLYFLQSFIPHKGLNLLSDYDKERLCDILACTVGRRNSKKYNDLYERLMHDLNLDIYSV